MALIMALSRQSKSFSIMVMVGITALGFASGYVGGLSGQQYITYIQELVPSQDQIQKPKGARPLSVLELIEHTSPSMVSLYRVQDDLVTDNIYPLPTKQSYIGDAVAVSADGWLVAPSALFAVNAEKKEKNETTEQKEQYLAIYKQEVYPINQTIIDTASSVSFLKINNASVRPVSFAWDQSMTGLLSGYSVTSNSIVTPLYVGQPRYMPATIVDDYLVHTNKLTKRLAPQVSFSAPGNAIVTENGDVVGIADRNGAIPVHYFRAALEQVLTTNSIQRLSLDIGYYDNAWMPHTQFSKTPIEMAGATIVDMSKVTSPEILSALKKGDVIIHVNNENIDINRSLSDIMSQYKSGTAVRFGIQRDGTPKEITLTLL